MAAERVRGEGGESVVPAHFVDEPVQGEVPAWEQIDGVRYMPRRIKGSCKGRALG